MTDYYHHVRSEIAPLLPKTIRQVLDVGCGAGATLRWIKSLHPQARTVGLEPNPELGTELARNADAAIIGKVEEKLSEIGPCDLILCLDVLEHLPHPENTLARLVERLDPGGSVIVSVPNVAHYSVSLPLLLRRRFRYADAGILDRTHMRFFVEESAVDLLRSAGLAVEHGLISGLQGPRTTIFNRLTFGVFRHFLAKQYIMLGEKRSATRSPERVAWRGVTDGAQRSPAREGVSRILRALKASA